MDSFMKVDIGARMEDRTVRSIAWTVYPSVMTKRKAVAESDEPRPRRP